MEPKPVGPVDATLVPRYAGPRTFARFPALADVPDAGIVVAGVPFDSGVSYRPGAPRSRPRPAVRRHRPR